MKLFHSRCASVFVAITAATAAAAAMTVAAVKAAEAVAPVAATVVIINYVMQSKIRLYNRIQKVSLDATR